MKEGMVAIAMLAIVGCDRALPPLPEVMMIVDTDVAVPLAASRLRIDVLAEDGTWLRSADAARPDPRDWPVSFGVYTEDATRGGRAWVRLRAYPDGRVRDYRGENPFTWGGAIDEGIAVTNAPRLIEDGRDVTPASEPDPIATIDRLVLVTLEPDQKREVHVVLHGACVGTSARFGADPARLVPGEAETCVDTEKARVAVAVERSDPEGTHGGESVQSTWLADPACPAPNGSARVCVPGGASLIGATDVLSSAVLPASPMRVVGVRRYFLDREEVTVGRLRDAIARGFVADEMPYANEAKLDATDVFKLCTWSKVPRDREGYAINCVSWFAARAFCHFEGGDLPTEVQWEHAATAAGHARKARYPWGDAATDCDHAVYGGSVEGSGVPDCAEEGPLPRPADGGPGDVSPLGIHGLAGGMTEWTLDVARPYTDACWGDAALVDPRCGDPEQDVSLRSTRGANYGGPMTFGSTRYDMDPIRQSTYVGFRCAYEDAGP
ncbi:serine/threonine kinase [Minicystis rosea]|nr:serine/threonine kinase [Minicystis rosea]